MLIVTGAGSGKNYRLPTGDELKVEIIRNCLNPGQSYLKESQPGYASTIVENTGKNINDLITEFGNVFGKSPSSIDLFLSRTTELNMKIGIYILAKQILLYEANSKRFFDFNNRDREDDWLLYLFDKIITYDTTIANLRVKIKKLPRIITFNYDRIIEFNFETFINADFAESDNSKGNIKKILREELDILHVYGKIGNLNWGFSDNVLPYGSLMPFENLTEFTKNISLMYKDRKKINIDEIKKLFKENKIIVFLGFAYDDFNFETLDLKKMGLDKKNIYGTIVGFNNNEKSELEGKLRTIFGGSSQINLLDCKCKELLRKLPSKYFKLK